MRVADIINEKGSEVVTIAPEASLAEVSAVLASRRIGAIVVEADGGIVGIISERDVVKALASFGSEALRKLVKDCMTAPVITCRPEETIDEVMQTMTAGRFRHVPVLRDGRLGGIISIGDVVKRRIEEVETEAKTIRDYIASA